MADIDIDPFGEHGPFGPGVAERLHESRPEEPTDENIPSDPVTPGRSSTWDPSGVPGLNWNASKKYHLEVEVVHVSFTKNT